MQNQARNFILREPRRAESPLGGYIDSWPNQSSIVSPESSWTWYVHVSFLIADGMMIGRASMERSGGRRFRSPAAANPSTSKGASRVNNLLPLQTRPCSTVHTQYEPRPMRFPIFPVSCLLSPRRLHPPDISTNCSWSVHFRPESASWIG